MRTLLPHLYLSEGLMCMRAGVSRAEFHDADVLAREGLQD